MVLYVKGGVDVHFTLDMQVLPCYNPGERRELCELRGRRRVVRAVVLGVAVGEHGGRTHTAENAGRAERRRTATPRDRSTPPKTEPNGRTNPI